jgi:trimeric autotransporter adhesin
MKGKNMNAFARIALGLVVGLLFPLQVVSAQDHQITYFLHNHAGAVTISFDDGRETQAEIAAPLMDAKGIKGTFFINPDPPEIYNDPTLRHMRVTWERWRELAAEGHEIASHTVNHAYLLDPTLTEEALRYELSESKRLINENIPSQSVISFSYPGNDNNAFVRAVTSEYYTSARAGWVDANGGGIMNFYEAFDPTWDWQNLDDNPSGEEISLGYRQPVDFYEVAGLSSAFNEPISYLEFLLDFAATYHSWFNIYFHDISWEPEFQWERDYFSSFLDDIKARDLWAGTYGQVALYMRERRASTVSVVQSDSSMIELSLTNSLDTSVYKQPLTIRSVVPSSWQNVSITQGNSSTSVASTLEGGTRVVYYDVVPNGGQIILSQPGLLSGVSMSPGTVQGGDSSTGTLTLTAPAPEGGITVNLTSSDTAAVQVPESVVVPAGENTATFSAATSLVNSETPVTITAQYDTASRTATLTVTAAAPVAALTTLSVSPASVLGGLSSEGTVTLNAVAPSGGAVVSLTSSNTSAASVPASVTVLAGETTATFNATTSSVNIDTPVTITAVYNSVSQMATLTVTAPPAALSALGMNPASVLSGALSTGTVTLDAPAPAGGAVVTLTSGNTAAAQVPASVMVHAGDTTATFNATTSSVNSDTPVTITAVYNSVSQMATLTVTAPVAALAALSVSPASVTGRTSSTGTVILTSPAPSGGAVVTLSSSNTSAATVPASVTVNAGATTATFTVTTSAVASDASVTISGNYGFITETASLTVNAAVLTSVSLNPTSVQGGTSSSGAVTLTGPAPEGGAVVALTSSNTSAATVRASVTVAAGLTKANFTVTTSAVSSDAAVTITGTYLATKTAQLAVTAVPAELTFVSLNPTSVQGGTPSTGTVTLTRPAPSGGAVVTLSSSNTSAATVPASVTVTAGATTATFTVTTNAVASIASVTISGIYRSVTKTASLTVNAAGLTSVSLSPTSVTGGASSTGTVTLTSPAPSGGAVVTLTSSNTAAATVPASVTVIAGATTATFTVTTNAVASIASVTISGIYRSVTKTASLTVNAAVLTSVSLSPASVIGGTSSTGTVTLTGPAPTGGAVVALTSSNTSAATVPASVTVNAGETKATFTVTTIAVASKASVSISGIYRSVTKTVTLAVNAAVLTSVRLSPTSVIGGTSSMGTVTLTGPAPTGGAVVALTSSKTTAATVPANVTVLEGSTSATFVVTTKAVSRSTKATISASKGTTTYKVTLTVTP